MVVDVRDNTNRKALTMNTPPKVTVEVDTSRMGGLTEIPDPWAVSQADKSTGASRFLASYHATTDHQGLTTDGEDIYTMLDNVGQWATTDDDDIIRFSDGSTFSLTDELAR